MNREQLCALKEIMEVSFVLIETALYLNTHPDDDRALRLHNSTSVQLNRLEAAYQSRFSPLRNTGMSRCPWSYINDPWPWEIDFTDCR